METINRRNFVKATIVGVSGGILAGGTISTPSNAMLQEQDLFTGINRAKDPQNLSPLEKKHVPEIIIPQTIKAGEPFEVKITVNHVMQNDHFINWINVFVADIPLGSVSFHPTMIKPQVTLTVIVDKPVVLRAQQNCNLHGLWENSVKISV